MHAHRHTYTRTHMHTHISKLTHIHTHAHTRMHRHTYIHAHTHRHMRACIHKHTHAHLCTHLYMLDKTLKPLATNPPKHARMHTHTHTHTHTHKHTHTNAHLCRFGQDPKALGYSHPFVLEPARLRRKHKHAKLLKPSLGKSLMPVCLCAFVYMYGCAHVCTYVWMIYFCWCVTAMSV